MTEELFFGIWICGIPIICGITSFVCSCLPQHWDFHIDFKDGFEVMEWCGVILTASCFWPIILILLLCVTPTYILGTIGNRISNNWDNIGQKTKNYITNSLKDKC